MKAIYVCDGYGTIFDLENGLFAYAVNMEDRKAVRYAKSPSYFIRTLRFRKPKEEDEAYIKECEQVMKTTDNIILMSGVEQAPDWSKI